MKNNGIIYIAIGKDHLDLARASACSLLKYSDEQYPLNITILTNAENDCFADGTGIDIKNISKKIEPIAGWRGDRIVACLKTWLCYLSPYDKTLFLDNDIRAYKNIDSIWNKVSYGIGFCKAFNPLDCFTNYCSDSEEFYTIKTSIPSSSVHQYNSGMFLFTSGDYVSKFFDYWNLEYIRYSNHENMALTRVLNSKRILPEIVELDRKYNDFYPNRDGNSILVHYIAHYKKYLDGYTELLTER